MFHAAVLRWMNELSAQGIFITDAQLTIREWNHWLEIHSGRSASEMIGKNLFEAYPELLERDIKRYYDEVLLGQTKVLSQRFHRFLLPFQLPVEDAGFKLMQQSTRIAPLIVENEVIGTITVIDDVTERIAREEQLVTFFNLEQKARQEAETANRLKDEFLATVSHELRTPLNAIAGWIQILSRQETDIESLKHGLTTMERNVKAQVQIIEDILDVSRIITGKLKLEIEQVDLIPIIEMALDTMRLAAEAKGINLQFIHDGDPVMLKGDPHRLQQIVWNLVSNAIKFTPEGGSVTVQLTRLDKQIDITVSDTGKGISSEFLPYVFDRFRQADSTTTRTHGGLGLGLSIVRHLVEMHGGTISATSSGQGEGATFTISLPSIADQYIEPLPIQTDHSQEEYASSFFPITSDSSNHETPDLTAISILIVDDDLDSSEMLKIILTNYGAEIRTAESAKAAMNTLESWTPKVIVSDIGMPNEDGYSLIQQIKDLEHTRGVKIPSIALTGYAGKQNQDLILAAGFQTHFSKPVDIDGLIHTITNLATTTDQGGSAMKSSMQK